MLLSKDFAGDAGGCGGNTPKPLVIGSCKWVSSLVTSLAQSDLRFFTPFPKSHVKTGSLRMFWGIWYNLV